MDGAIESIEAIFEAMPLALLEVWGRFGYLLGFFFMVCAFGGFTFNPGNRWGLGRQWQAWDAKALRSLVLTFVLVLGSGYLGSFIVLVPGAQTFESLKDLSVFLCIVLFGYPALIIVPFAYGLSDLIEGVPPAFLLDWFCGYFINPACYWLAYQLFGKNPDFTLARTWGRYLLFVLVFMSIEPQLWGYICSGKFTPDISYRTITPALFFTTGITWMIAPVAMLLALPLARRFGMFWAEIPGHVQERELGRKEWMWESGKAETSAAGDTMHHGMPIRMFLVTPFIVLVLVMVASTAYFALRSTEQSATKLAARIHEDNISLINLYLDDHLERSHTGDAPQELEEISRFLQGLPFARHGRIFVLDRTGRQLASSANSVLPVAFDNGGEAVERQAIGTLKQMPGALEQLKSEVQFKFDVVTAKPLSRETWLSHAAPYRNGTTNWILVTAMPSAYYLEGVRTGNSRSAMVFAVALTLSLVVAAYLATIVTAPICRISQASEQLMKGDLAQRVPHSVLGELGMLARSFNRMAEALQKSFSDLLNEVDMRKRRERELEESQLRVRLNENRLQLATRAAGLGIWDWDVERNELVWDDAMYQQYGIDKSAFDGAYEAWSRCLAADDFEKATADVAAALRGERDFDSEFRVCWPDGSIHTIRGIAQTIRSEDGRPVRMVGVNFDITEQKHAAEQIMKLNADLEARVIERTAQLEAANKELEAFSYSVSHDLKAPLRGIDGYSQLLEETASEHLDEEARAFLRNIRQGAAQMHALIEDLLDYARMERRTLGNDNVNVAAWVDSIVQEFRHDVDERNFELRCEVPALIARADREGLAIVLRNLIDNALKFSRNANPPVIEIGAREAGGNVLLWVRDNGVGFDMKFHERIFDIFSRLHRTEDYVGTGVGLALVRKAMQRMGGRVWAESAPGRGATFFLELRHG